MVVVVRCNMHEKLDFYVLSRVMQRILHAHTVKIMISISHVWAVSPVDHGT